MKDLIDFNYDEVYVLSLISESMESLIGFKRIFKKAVSEEWMNILFLENNSQVDCLYGNASDTGYYIELPIGAYTNQDLVKWAIQRQNK